MLKYVQYKGYTSKNIYSQKHIYTKSTYMKAE